MENQHQEKPKEHTNNLNSVEARLPDEIVAYRIAQKAKANQEASSLQE